MQLIVRSLHAGLEIQGLDVPLDFNVPVVSAVVTSCPWKLRQRLPEYGPDASV